MFDLICEPFRHGNITVFNEIFSNFGPVFGPFWPHCFGVFKNCTEWLPFYFFP